MFWTAAVGPPWSDWGWKWSETILGRLCSDNETPSKAEQSILSSRLGHWFCCSENSFQERWLPRSPLDHLPALWDHLKWFATDTSDSSQTEWEGINENEGRKITEEKQICEWSTPHFMAIRFFLNKIKCTSTIVSHPKGKSAKVLLRCKILSLFSCIKKKRRQLKWPQWKNTDGDKEYIQPNGTMHIQGNTSDRAKLPTRRKRTFVHIQELSRDCCEWKDASMGDVHQLSFCAEFLFCLQTTRSSGYSSGLPCTRQKFCKCKKKNENRLHGSFRVRDQASRYWIQCDRFLESFSNPTLGAEKNTGKKTSSFSHVHSLCVCVCVFDGCVEDV